MKYYKDNQNNVFAYELDGSQDYLIGDNVAMTAKEVEAHINPPMTIEQKQRQFRAERNNLLVEADIEINKLVDLGLDSTEWRVYRQALRDSTLTWGLPSKPIGGN